MGIGYTIDTAVKVAPFGISSVLSLVDDILIEKMRAFYCRKMDLPYEEITEKTKDHRAHRITAYLNLIDDVVKNKFNQLKISVEKKGNELEKYIDMLPDLSYLKIKAKHLLTQEFGKGEIRKWLETNLSMGSIDVNIMTKLDKENYEKQQALPSEYNDAHSALRGFAKSKLNSSIVLSAGMNPRLYSYMENFEDFFPDENEDLKKKIILKVSDFRSALIQGKFLAKKGLWVSEYRIESGLNCGGHAFATDGYLMGPILEEFKNKREDLIQSTYDLWAKALETKNLNVPRSRPNVRFSAQGGVGTAHEHDYLLKLYQLDSIGWGTPFLLVPEATNVDPKTLNLLSKAKEKDLELSQISPLGVLFNNLKGNTKDLTKVENIRLGRPGSSCPKKFVAINKEFKDKGLCIASRQYQDLKIKELKAKNFSPEDYQKEYEKVVAKSCICVGLGTSALLVNNLDHKVEGDGVSVCPGPNMAYFTQKASLQQMTDHIYGRKNLNIDPKRPHMFIKELRMYINYLNNRINEWKEKSEENQRKVIQKFHKNLFAGVSYYLELFNMENLMEATPIKKALEEGKQKLETLVSAFPQP
ncbi:hypothetical protein E1171_05270, partial [Cytophagales bacterium RKSG123]|nr:hypothetical protein [Xanthovirga aplysinae]